MAFGQRIRNPEEGELVLPWMRELVDWGNGLPVRAAPNLDVRMVPGMGTTVSARPVSGVAWPWQVSTGLSLTAAVSIGVVPGRAEGVIPLMRDEFRNGALWRLDGVDPSKPDEEAGFRPSLAVDRPRAGRESWIALRLIVDGSDLPVAVDEQLPEHFYEVVALDARPEGGWGAVSVIDGEDLVHEPLAVLWWGDTGDDRVLRVTMTRRHSVQRMVVEGGEDVRGRHFFSAV